MDSEGHKQIEKTKQDCCLSRTAYKLYEQKLHHIFFFGIHKIWESIQKKTEAERCYTPSNCT